MGRVSVNFKVLCAYLFVLVLVYLAGTYVAHAYFVIYVFMLILPIYSILQVVLSAMSLECIQAFETDNPSKGDVIHYRVWVSGKPFLTTEVNIQFRPVHNRLPYRIPELHLALTGKRLVERAFDIHLRHRGSYTLGIEVIRISDALGWLTLTKLGTSRTFYVHPRILTLKPPAAETRVHALSESGVNGVEEDLTMFEGLAGYREGEPIKHVAWKKYLTTGTPYLKRFGGSSEPAVMLYLDLRMPVGFPPQSEAVPTTEDCSIEMAISLVKGYLDRGNRVTVRAATRWIYTFVGTHGEDFARFFEETDDLVFSPGAPSPARLYESDRSESPMEGSVLFVTHIIDDHLFEVVSERNRASGRTGVFLNTTALNETEKERAASYGQLVRSSAGGIFRSAHSASLKEDLVRWEVR